VSGKHIDMNGKREERDTGAAGGDDLRSGRIEAGDTDPAADGADAAGPGMEASSRGRAGDELRRDRSAPWERQAGADRVESAKAPAGSTGEETPAEVSTESPSIEEELRSVQDRLLRQAAEFQNFRRRVEQERKNDLKFGQSLVLREMLDVYDDLRRSLEAAAEAAGKQGGGPESASGNGLKEGVELVYRKFTDTLQRFGVEPIEAVGAAFDEREHEAMMQQPAPKGTPPGTVLGEIQKGYRMGDRVLRHSKVVVSA